MPTLQSLDNTAERLMRYAMLIAAVFISTAATADTPTLEEIIVTAEKRGDISLQDVPASIASISGENLERISAIDFEDYSTRIPNLSFGYTDDGRMNARGIAIRGVSGRNTTGFYIDDTPLQEGIDPFVLDIERVEVLRGPQGSLYGSQSMGGTIRLISRMPDLSDSSFNIKAGFSSVEQGGGNYTISSAFNAPLSPGKVALRASAYVDEQSGVFDRIVTGPMMTGTDRVEDVDDQSTLGFQAALMIAPNDRLTILPRLWFQKTEQDGAPFADIEPGTFDQVRMFDINEVGEDEWLNANLSINYATDFGTFTSSTSYLDREVVEEEDTSEAINFIVNLFFGFDPGAAVISDQGLEIQTLTQEFRFASELDGPLQYVAGLYFSDEEQLATLGPIPVEGFVPDFASFVTTIETQETAFFGEAYYSFTDSLTMTLGGRFYDIEVKDNTQLSGLFFGGISTTPLTATEDGFNPKIQLSYEANDDVLLYATASQGFRRGGTSPVPLAPNCNADVAALGLSIDDTRSFESDDLWNYEIGAKTTFSSGRVRLNGAIFKMDWSDIQQTINLQCGSRFIGNAGEAEIEGFEIEFEAAVTENLVVSLGAGRSDGRISAANATLPVTVGDPLNQVPEWTYNTSVDYGFSMGDATDGFIRFDYRFVDESFSFNVVEDASIEPRARPDYSIADMSIGLSRGNWEFSVFAKNLFDEHANLADNVSIGLELPGRPRIVTNRPRTVGATVRMHF